METEKLQVGLVGLGVMGENLALNVEEKGFSVAVHNRSPEKVDAFLGGAAAGKKVQGFKDPASFAAALERPRRVLLMVQAGAAVDGTLAALEPQLEAGDLVVDGGNSLFSDTERRAGALAARGLRFFGMGVSGGEEGARHGPSLMPGGDREAYARLAPVLERIAAQVADGACVTHCGKGGAGHYVKMVHNGIEYGDMQLIAEAYDALKTLGGLDNDALAGTFAAWNEGDDLGSYLVEITARIFRVEDPEAAGTGARLVDAILDTASMKGTGKWTVQDAAELGIPIPTIASAVDARLLSAQKATRTVAARALGGPVPGRAAAAAASAPAEAPTATLVDDVRAALYCAKVCSYAQGMSLLAAASTARGWGIPLAEVARIWKGGCIIRARLLGDIQAAFARDGALPSLLLDARFGEALAVRQDGWRRLVAAAARAGLSMPTTTASLGYYDSVRRARGPANLTQAQRDYFGAHTFQRNDRPGSFHFPGWSL
jgi:6-phosphogluconate dehydrogenase